MPVYSLSGVIVLLAVLGLKVRQRRRQALRMEKLARQYEHDGRYEAACYHYAIAASIGRRGECEPLVRALWRAHGPFSFSDISSRMRHEYCSVSESCGEGFHQLTLRDLMRMVGRIS